MCPCMVCFYPNRPCYDKCRTGNLNVLYTLIYTIYIILRAELVGCPVFSDDVIVQQPADFLNLTNQYVAHAKMAIEKATGIHSSYFFHSGVDTDCYISTQQALLHCFCMWLSNTLIILNLPVRSSQIPVSEEHSEMHLMN